MGIWVDKKDRLVVCALFNESPQSVVCTARVRTLDGVLHPIEFSLSSFSTIPSDVMFHPLPEGELLYVGVSSGLGPSLGRQFQVSVGLTRGENDTTQEHVYFLQGLIGIGRQLSWPMSVSEGPSGGLSKYGFVEFTSAGPPNLLEPHAEGPCKIAGFSFILTTSATPGTRSIRFGYEPFFPASSRWFDLTFPFLPSSVYNVQAISTTQPVVDVVVDGAHWVTFGLPVDFVLDGRRTWSIYERAAVSFGDIFGSLYVDFLY